MRKSGITKPKKQGTTLEIIHKWLYKRAPAAAKCVRGRTNEANANGRSGIVACATRDKSINVVVSCREHTGPATEVPVLVDGRLVPGRNADRGSLIVACAASNEFLIRIITDGEMGGPTMEPTMLVERRAFRQRVNMRKQLKEGCRQTTQVSDRVMMMVAVMAMMRNSRTRTLQRKMNDGSGQA